jgi:TPR repeat protein
MRRSRDAIASSCRLLDHGRPREAFRLLLRAAQAGDTAVYLNLGYAYDVGQGTRQSKRKALYWYQRASAKGASSAAHNIATVYRDRGQVLRAIRWLERAVALGDSASNLDLGQLLLARLGQPGEALTCFRNVGVAASEADIEAATVWSAVAQGILVRHQNDRRHENPRAAEQLDAPDERREPGTDAARR